MLIVLSPAKTLDYESPLRTRKFTQPAFLDDSEKLVKTMRKYSPDDISELMHVSAKIAELNFSRYLDWEQPFSPENARQAIFAFKGDVYTGLEVQQFKAADLDFAQKHLRILSGLYGLLRPLDLMRPYRLEMGIKLKNSRGNTLYDYWSDQVTAAVNEVLQSQKDKLLVNLASNEYFKVLDKSGLQGKLVTPVFKDYKNGQYKVISFFAKKARGLMAAHAIRKRAKSLADLQSFNAEGYRFSKKDSDESKLVFLRKQE
tara:strand:- start:1955 stop:2728 length:774 start_codon:yes stop_codon:yes gene_type:complete